MRRVWSSRTAFIVQPSKRVRLFAIYMETRGLDFIVPPSGNAGSAFEHVAGPVEPHRGAGFGQAPVGEGYGCAGAFQQRLGDEEAETKAAARLAAAGLAGVAWPAMRDVGLAEPADDVGRKARPVIGDRDADAAGVPARRDGHVCVREVDRVLDDVAEPV